MNTFGSRIQDLRIGLGLTQEELALKLDYKSRSYINKIESGETDIPHSKIVDFAEALNTTPMYLMGWEDDTKSLEGKNFDKKRFSKLLLEAIGDISIIEFAGLSGVNRTYLSKYINKRLETPPSPHILKEISEASIGVNYYELLEASGYVCIDEMKEYVESKEDIETKEDIELMLRLRPGDDREYVVVNKDRESVMTVLLEDNRGLNISEREVRKTIEDMYLNAIKIREFKFMRIVFYR